MCVLLVDKDSLRVTLARNNASLENGNVFLAVKTAHSLAFSLARVCVSVGMKMAMKSFLLSSKLKSCCVSCPNLDPATPQMKIHIASSLKKFITGSLPNRSKLQSFRIIFHDKLKVLQRILIHIFKCLVCPIPVAFREF